MVPTGGAEIRSAGKGSAPKTLISGESGVQISECIHNWEKGVRTELEQCFSRCAEFPTMRGQTLSLGSGAPDVKAGLDESACLAAKVDGRVGLAFICIAGVSRCGRKRRASESVQSERSERDRHGVSDQQSKERGLSRYIRTDEEEVRLGTRPCSHMNPDMKALSSHNERDCAAYTI